MSTRIHVFVEGRVQGVGYRYSACAQARALGLSGWVRNCQDGRVEAVFEGEKNALEGMLAWCREGPRGARVSEVETEWEEGPAEYSGFAIRL